MCITVHNHYAQNHFVQKPHMNVSILTNTMYGTAPDIERMYIIGTHVATMLNTC